MFQASVYGDLLIEEAGGCFIFQLVCFGAEGCARTSRCCSTYSSGGRQQLRPYGGVV